MNSDTIYKNSKSQKHYTKYIMKKKKSPEPTYAVTISPEYMIANFNAGTKTELLDVGGTLSIGVMSNDANGILDASSAPLLGHEINKIKGGFELTWNLDKTKLSDLKSMVINFTKTLKGNISWTVFSLNFKPLAGPSISNKYLPMVYITTANGWQDNLNSPADNDFILSGPGYTSKGQIPKNTNFGPSGSALSVSHNYFQTFDSLELQPVYLVSPPPSPIPSPNNFIFRGDRPLGVYKVNGIPYAIDPSGSGTSNDIETCAENQFIDFPLLYKYMKSRFQLQASGRGATFPTTFKLVDVSITALNQQYTGIPTTDLPYQELRSFDRSTYNKTTTQSEYEAILDTANLNMSLPESSTISTFKDDDGETITIETGSKFSWVDLGTTNPQPFVSGQSIEHYITALQTDYNLDVVKFHRFIRDLIDFEAVDGGVAHIIYMHCNAGTMRTGAFNTCYLLTQHFDISIEKAAYYGKSLFGNDAGSARIVVTIHDYWPLVQNYCAYLDLLTKNSNPRNAALAEPTDNPFKISGSPYKKYPNPWQWKQKTEELSYSIED